MIKLQLHENWQLCNIRQLDWIPAQIPGDIYAALLKTGKMPDPFFGDNEYQAKALMEEDYEYRTVFNYEEAQFKDCQEVILRFDGIDTIADIYLNGCCVIMEKCPGLIADTYTKVMEILTEREVLKL